jgi:NitT/TauT family transport system substrate-binding protein
MSSIVTRRFAIAGMAGALASLKMPAARAAAGKLRVGKAVVQNFGFVPLDVGMKYGVFAKHGLAIEELNFVGGAKLAQALTAGAVDIALSAGPEMAFVAKGAPELAVGSISSSPAFMAMIVAETSPGEGIGALKGKKIGVTSPGSLTVWLVKELNRVQGWTGADAADPVVIGGAATTQIAALKTGLVYAVDGGVTLGFELEARHVGRVLIDCSAYVKSIELFTTFASDAVIERDPDAVRRFLAAWYETVGFMRGHKPETVAVASDVMDFAPPVAARAYDALISNLSTDGSFVPEALTTLRASFVDLDILKPPIDMSKLYTEKFLPRA